MSKLAVPGTLAASDLAGLDIRLAGAVDVRRDLYLFVRYVQDRGLVRSVRGNQIPKVAARQLAKILSWEGEARAVEKHGCGDWSGRISWLARALGLVAFDDEGVYRGYTSTEPSYPDNQIEIAAPAWRKYLALPAGAKARALLEAFLKTTGSEFYHSASLWPDEAFDRRGSAIGPAGKMDLERVRRGLLDFLADLEPEVWYETRAVVDRLQERAPHLILDPSTREPDDSSKKRLRDWNWDRKGGKEAGVPRPAISLEDIYSNFRERQAGPDRWTARGERQITSRDPDAFRRVEGRYLEFFLREIPYLCGFVDLACRDPADPHGMDVHPAFERLRAFRLTRRFFQVMRADPEYDRVRVTVLPTFEILVEAPAYPETVLAALEPFARTTGADGPVQRLRLERKLVVEAAARDPGARPAAEVLAELGAAPLPENVAAELSAWMARSDKVILYSNLALLEIAGDPEIRGEILRSLGDRVVDAGPEAFAIVRDPGRALEILEEGQYVPVRVEHGETALAACPGRLGKRAAAPRTARLGATPVLERVVPKPKKASVRLETEDLVACRSSSAALLGALHEALAGKARTCALVSAGLLVLSAAALPDLRAALRRLSDRFEVTEVSIAADDR